MVVALAVCVIMGTMACSKDEDDANANPVVGEWVRQDGKSDATWEFFKDGTGMYDSGGLVWGNFSYIINDNSISIRIKYCNRSSHATWKDNFPIYYISSNDELWINSKVWVRKNRNL
jgi:hypothetical protein